MTGGSGYVAGWTIVDLLRRGWTVRTTIRDLAREPRIRARLAVHAPIERLSFHAANLLDDRGWDAAVDEVSHVIHTASPMPVREYRAQDLIEPARAGVRRSSTPRGRPACAASS
ncbi:NAD-dependent epimerase/dehydratase family protein [Caulobacter segnis]